MARLQRVEAVFVPETAISFAAPSFAIELIELA
ncbi:MAG: hypothetical protein ACI9DO_002595 [Reinekea sp.]|jgi:hypothetical protein